MVRPIPASPVIPSDGGLPHTSARSATTLDVSRPAQRSLAITACRLAASPKRHICLEGSDGFVTSTAAPIAPGWSDPVARRDLHPLKTNTLTRRTLAASPFPSLRTPLPSAFPSQLLAEIEHRRGKRAFPAKVATRHEHLPIAKPLGPRTAKPQTSRIRSRIRLIRGK